MAVPKSFAAIVDSKAIRDAIETLTPNRILIFVEGESDWLWLNPKVVKNKADVRYELDDDGGVDYVLERVRACKAKGTRCIGIIDRDFAGLEGTRHENLLDEVFDTELHDSEVVMIDAGALSLAMEWHVPPKRRPGGISEARIEKLRREVLAAAGMLGAVRLVNLKRRPARAGISKELMDRWIGTFSPGATGKWELLGANLLTLLPWDSAQKKSFGDDLKEACRVAREEAKHLLPDGASPDDIEYVMTLLLCNGHDLMHLMATCWHDALAGTSVSTPTVAFCRKELSDLMRSLFDFVMFKRTRLHEKIDEFCLKRYGQSIFITT